MPSPLAFSPCSITCVFVPVVGPNPEQTYSLGYAINLSAGVTAALLPAAAHSLTYNGRPMELPTVRSVLEQLAPEPLQVLLRSPVPLGCGFGASGAAALSTAWAIAKRFDLALSPQQLAEICHAAEVRHRTGLGDVAAQLVGGVVWRRCQSGPLDAVQLPVEPEPLFYRVFGPLLTSRVLQSRQLRQAIEQHGRQAIEQLQQQGSQLSLPVLLDVACQFAEATGLAEQAGVGPTLAGLRAAGEHGTMIMLGRSVIATGHGPPGDEWTRCEIDREGTRWL